MAPVPPAPRDMFTKCTTERRTCTCHRIAVTRNAMRDLVANAILECAQKGIFNPFEIAPRVSMSRSNPCLILRLTKAAGSGAAICIRSAAARPCARCDNFCVRNPSCRRRSVAVAQTNSPNPLRWSGFREKRSHIRAEDLIHEGLVHGLAHELTIAA